jgi:toxoflavin biosynthesis protein ToxD
MLRINHHQNNVSIQLRACADYNDTMIFRLLIFSLSILTLCDAAVAQAPQTVPVSAGVFIMGSDKAEREAAYLLDETAYGHARTRQWKWYDNEQRRQPNISAFQITRTLITNRQYLAFITATGHPAPSVDAATWKSYKLIHPYARTRRHTWKDGTPPQGRLDHPVVMISHTDAQIFARWLSQKTGQSWRLPTEEEWEKAARGDDGQRFPWGQKFEPNRLNSHDLGPFDTLPVGRYPKGASPYGLMDAAGQVFEWTATPAPGSNHFIVKGGSWDDKGCGICRPAARHGRPAFLKHILVGFRLVRDD